ncbi:hypothetical protein BPNPMPFG_006303 [Mesorhizobium sp. AR07]|uniref:hypothetical protein n=1 Tax=Mesorhizobium sp. AR07 TaxID=2865838 RepID=UPI002160CA06|nr:hypothetical protein [Mesorhizobium sp. AR07]UVK44388.1 hypothetical protein BPNPMPFG_006303 [Mesorhizobium sp. AR07]
MPGNYNWTYDYGRDEHTLRLDEEVEICVVRGTAGVFEGYLFDLTNQEAIWHGDWPTLVGARLACIAAGKRLGYIVVGRLTEDEQEASEDSSGSPTSIWEYEPEIFSYCAWMEGNGLGIDCVVTPLKDGGFEGDVVLGTQVFRIEYENEWFAKNGVLSRAKAMINSAVMH